MRGFVARGRDGTNGLEILLDAGQAYRLGGKLVISEGDGEKGQRGDGGDSRAEKNADGEQAEDDASDENNNAVVGAALGGDRHKGKSQR